MVGSTGGGSCGSSGQKCKVFEVFESRPKTRKGNGEFLNPPIFVGTTSALPPYIRWCGHVIDEYKPRIFVGDVASLMNLWGWSKSTQVPHWLIGDKYTPMNIAYIHRFWVPMNIF
jgi:hypothetical protein